MKNTLILLTAITRLIIATQAADPLVGSDIDNAIALYGGHYIARDQSTNGFLTYIFEPPQGGNVVHLTVSGHSIVTIEVWSDQHVITKDEFHAMLLANAHDGWELTTHDYSSKREWSEQYVNVSANLEADLACTIRHDTIATISLKGFAVGDTPAQTEPTPTRVDPRLLAFQRNSDEPFRSSKATPPRFQVGDHVRLKPNTPYVLDPTKPTGNHGIWQTTSFVEATVTEYNAVGWVILDCPAFSKVASTWIASDSYLVPGY